MNGANFTAHPHPVLPESDTAGLLIYRNNDKMKYWTAHCGPTAQQVRPLVPKECLSKAIPWSTELNSKALGGWGSFLGCGHRLDSTANIPFQLAEGWGW